MSMGLAIEKVAVYSTIPRGVARREMDIGDEGVVRIAGVEFAAEVAASESQTSRRRQMTGR